MPSQEQDFARMIELLEEISRKLDALAPREPDELFPPKTSTCVACGVTWSGPMGYACPRSDCPTAPRAVFE